MTPKQYWDELWKWENQPPTPPNTQSDPYAALSLAQQVEDAEKALSKAKAAKKPDTSAEEKRLKKVRDAFDITGGRVAKKLESLLPKKPTGEIDWDEFKKWMDFGLDPANAGGSGNKPIIDASSLMYYIFFVQKWIESRLRKVAAASTPADKTAAEGEVKTWQNYLRKLLDSELDRIDGLAKPLPKHEEDRKTLYSAKRTKLPAIAMADLGDVMKVFAFVEFTHPITGGVLKDLRMDMALYSLNAEFTEKPAIFINVPPATPIENIA